jgi:hypothetical protein
LKSLKTDSEMAIPRLAVVGRENRSGEFRIMPQNDVIGMKRRRKKVAQKRS